jgi:hypothetical protein
METNYGTGNLAVIAAGVTYRFTDRTEAEAFAAKTAAGNREKVGLYDLSGFDSAFPIAAWGPDGQPLNV